MTIVRTPEQEAIVAFAKTRKESLLINALAGSSKTTTLVMAAHEMPLQPTLCLAFNKKIALEFGQRMPPHITCATLNSIGHRAWGAHVGHRLVVETDKTYNALTALISNLRKEEREVVGEAFSSILRAIRSAKSSGYVPGKFSTLGAGLVSEDEFRDAVTASADVEPDDLFWSLVDEVLCQGIAEGFQGKIDFDDQVYLSTLFSKNYPKYPVTLVDEAQDLSALNHRTLELMFGGRLIAVGDRHQSVYGFRGAHAHSMAEMQKQFSMDELSLSISFRCPKAVVREVNHYVPAMCWPDWAIEGKVESLREWSPDTPPDGSVVICRNNAPLFKVAMAFIRAGRGVKMAKSDIGAGLVKLLKKMGKPETKRNEVVLAIERWREEQVAKASRSRVAPIHDRADCLLVFSEHGETLKEAIAFAEHLFSASGPVLFMTGHGSKGLEFKNVFFLDSFLIPSKWARAQAELGDKAALTQELNLQYVVRTRTQENLFYVNSEDLV